MRLFITTALLCIASVGHSVSQPKSHAIPNVVRVLLKPDVVLALRPIFTEKRGTNSDIQTIVLDSTNGIAELLDLSPVLHVTRLRPFMPEHSVVFESIREHINPNLFRPTPPLSARHDEDDLLRISEEKLSRWFTLAFSDGLSPETVAGLCRRSSKIEFAEPVYAREVCANQYHPNDSLVDSLYALRMMKAFEAWKIVRCDSAIPNQDTMLLADVDIGVWLDHPDLHDAIWYNAGEEGTYVSSGQTMDRKSNGIDDDSDGYVDDFEGWDFVNFISGLPPDKSPWSISCPPHGTHTTGIMAATGNNKRGIAGVAFGAKVIIIKAAIDGMNGFQPPPIQAGDEGIVFSADHHAKIINCSFGGPERSQSEQDVVDYAYGRGSIVVVSAGNSGAFQEFYPASCNHAFSVTSVDSNHSFYHSAPDYNHHVAVAAPGQDILSTIFPTCGDSTGYGGMSGTSMAAPEVSGALGLVWQHYPLYTNRQVMERLRVTCDSLGNSDIHPGFDGKGFVNILRAVTDSSIYSLRLDHVDGPDGELAMSSGQTATFLLTFKNYLDPLSRAIAVPQVLDSLDNFRTPVPSASQHITCSTKVVDIGTLVTFGQAKGLALTIHADSSVAPQTKVLIRLWLSDSSLGYVGDYDYFEFSINPGLATLDTNNLLVSFDDKGCIGFRDQITDQEGYGFVWNKAPVSVPLFHTSVLLGGGLIIARDTQHVVDGLGDYTGRVSSAFALNPLTAISRTFGTPFGDGQTISSSFSDSLADSAMRVGIRVEEHDYALLSNAAANSVICDYTFFPRTDLLPFDAGLFMDWDIGRYGTKDSALFSKADSIFYIWRNEANYPVVGMKLTSHITSGAISYYAMRNDANDGGMHIPFPGDLFGTMPTFPDSLKWKFLERNKGGAGSGDVAVVLGQRGLDYSKGTPRLTYIMSFGLTQEDVQKSINNTQAIMEGRQGIDTAHPTEGPSIEIWPVPATNSIRLDCTTMPAVCDIKLWDALGRCVMTLRDFENGGQLSVSSLPAGVYTIELTGGNAHLFKAFVKE